MVDRQVDYTLTGIVEAVRRVLYAVGLTFMKCLVIVCRNKYKRSEWLCNKVRG